MSIGAMLRERREELGWELPEIASYLRIRLPYLEAIEAENYALLPGSAFTIGFIRTYSHHLGFDSEKVLNQFRKDSAGAAQRPALVVRAPIDANRHPTLWVVVAAIILLALIWGGWAFFAGHDHSVAELVPSVPDRLKPQAPSASAPAQPTPASGTAEKADSLPAEVAGSEGEADEAANDMQEPSNGSRGGPFAVNAAPAQGAPAPAAPGVNYGVPGAPAGHVEIRAIDNAWVQVVDNTGAAIFTGVLHPGDKFPVPAGKAYTLTTGNAGGIELAVDGVAGQPLGETGRILRGIPLDSAHAASPEKTP